MIPAMKPAPPTARRMGPAILSGLPPTGVYPGHTAMIVMTSPMKANPMNNTIRMIIYGLKRGGGECPLRCIKELLMLGAAPCEYALCWLY